MTMLIVLAALPAMAVAQPPAPSPPLTTPAPAAAAPAAGAVATPPSGKPRPTRAQVLAAVRAEWGRFDTRHAGRLGPLEFSTWVVQANGAHVAPAGLKGAAGIRPVSAMNATARAFARADADHDGGVTPDEMTDFLMK